MADSDAEYEADLARALAMSLKESKGLSAEFVDLVSESESDDSDDLDRPPVRRFKPGSDSKTPVKASKRNVSANSVDSTQSAADNVVVLDSDSTTKTTCMENPKGISSTSLQIPGPVGMASFGNDRKAMEAERLARANKRKAAVSPPSRGFSDRASVEYMGENSRPIKRQSVRSNLPNQSDIKGFLTPRQLTDQKFHQPAKVTTDRQPDLGSRNSKGKEKAPKETVSSDTVLPNPEEVIPGFQEFQRLQNPSMTARSGAPNPEVMSYRQQQDLSALGIKFPHGVVKKTWAYGYPRKDDIKIEEVLQKNDLELAVLSAFQWDEEWILGKVDMARTKVVCVVQAETEMQKAAMQDNVPSNIRFCFPSMEGQINCMHSKLMLLSHPGYLRIAVPSANLVSYDWGEAGGVMENTVFIIDLPRLANKQRIKPEDLTLFGRELRYFVKAQELDEKVVDSLLNFDFSKTAPFGFVHTIGGSHSGESWKRTGYCGLGSAVKELGLATDGSVEIDLVSASIGNLKDEFIRSIYLAAKGDNGMIEYNWRSNRPSKARNALATPRLNPAEERLWAEAKEHFRIYFPTRETVAESKGGVGAGGTICFQSQWYDGADFPRSLMRDCKSVRPHMLMHNKMIFVRPQSTSLSISDIAESTAWTYVGSANLSESAWGRLVKDRITKAPKLNCRNWECGVVIPVKHADKTTSRQGTAGEVLGSNGSERASIFRNFNSEDGHMSMKVFESVVPVPMTVPGEEYGTRRPWFWKDR